MPGRDDDADHEVPERERARQRRRDRKRETRMVVDNAGIRRVLPAVRRRQTKPESPDGGGRDAKPG